MGFLLMMLLGVAALLVGGVALIALVSSGLGIPFLVLPLAWWLMWRHNKKLEKEKQP